MQGALLWVYEGMTQYLGDVLAARSGLKNAQQYRDMLAMTAASLDYTRGREWRPTQDTAVSVSILRGGNPAWANWRRSHDYYDEGELLWLDADTLIRKMTENKKSLDDFQKIFLGRGGNTGPLIVTYTFDELVQDLNRVAPYDWATFLHDRAEKINPRADELQPAMAVRIAGIRLDCESELMGRSLTCFGGALRTRPALHRARRSWQ